MLYAVTHLFPETSTISDNGTRLMGFLPLYQSLSFAKGRLHSLAPVSYVSTGGEALGEVVAVRVAYDNGT